MVLQEHKSVWDTFVSMCEACHTKMVGKCVLCMKSQVRKDAEHHSVLAEEMGKENTVSKEDPTHIETEVPPISNDAWCCMYRVLSLQEDFWTEKPLIQCIIEEAGHVCLFLPQFHCELNPIEMLWGYAKYCMCIWYASCMRHTHRIICCPGY